MTLSRRLLYFLYMACACSVVLASFVLFTFSMRLVDSLAMQNAEQQLEKVEAAFLDQLSILRIRALDWSKQPETLPTDQGGIGRLDVLWYLQHDQVSSLRGDVAESHPVIEGLSARFVDGYCFPIWGVVELDGKPLLFSTAVEEDCQAYLVGVWVDSAWMYYLSERVGHGLYVRHMAPGATLQRGVEASGENHLRGRFPVPDFLGGPPLEVAVELQPPGYQDAITTTVIVIVIIALLLFVAASWVNMRIRPQLFGRLQLLHDAVRSIARGGTLDQRVPVSGEDEIGVLAEDFNTMVDSIEHAQSQLGQARRQAEVANQAKSQFLANISHEIRTPMTAILGYTELLRDGNLSLSEQRQYLDIIRNNGDALLALINDVLDLSRVESGQMQLEQAPFSVHKLVDEVIASHQLRARQKALQLEVCYLGAIPERLSGDAYRLRQVLMNLIGNAVKFTESGSVRVSVAWQSAEQRLRILVSDTGIGISSVLMERIFQPFSQADASHTRRYAGTGLGLSIARQLARSQGGDITVHSEEGRGSEFELLLPLTEYQGDSDMDQLSESVDTVDNIKLAAVSMVGTVLLVEDNEVNRLFVSKLLQRAGMTVVEVEHGKEACDRLAVNERFDLIILDMQMPVMDGYQTVAAIRDMGCETPVLALTANVMAEERQRCLAAGCDAFMGKPVKVQALLSVCAELMAARVAN